MVTTVESVRERIPEPAKKVVRSGRFAYRRATQTKRVLPDFIIIGAQRCGTSSFYDLLSRHPAVIPAFAKEIHFFDLQWSKGEGWYRGHFPLGSRKRFVERRRRRPVLTGEATPYYLFHPRAPNRVFATVPGAKLIVLLRDPVMRAYSHYEWMRRHRLEALPFADAVQVEAERLEPEIRRMEADPSYDSAAHRNFGYLARGRYAEQLSRWMALFPEEQLLVLRSEDLFQKPHDVYLQTVKFLDLPAEFPQSLPHRGGQEYSPDESVRRFLVEYFREHNDRLYELLGRDFQWAR